MCKKKLAKKTSEYGMNIRLSSSMAMFEAGLE